MIQSSLFCRAPLWDQGTLFREQEGGRAEFGTDYGRSPERDG